MIIGPNGTGKSTIVCAIVLGLGGKLSTIGRAAHVAEYVKAGCEQAKIEIHLTNGQKDDIVICRQFNIQGKSSWLLNGSSSNIKEIQNLTKTFDIQVLILILCRFDLKFFIPCFIFRWIIFVNFFHKTKFKIFQK